MAIDIKIYPGFTSSDYDEDLWIATANNANSPFRVEMSKVLEARGVIGHPTVSAAWQFPNNFRLHSNPAGYFFIGPVYNQYPQLKMLNTGQVIFGADDNSLLQIQGSQIQAKGFNGAAGYALAIYNDSGSPYRRAVADMWAIYSSFAVDKENLTPIEKPLEKSTQIRGYNYTQQGKEMNGFTIDDIQAHFPSAVQLDETGEAVAYDSNALLALAFESIRLLEERVADLEAQKG